MRTFALWAFALLGGFSLVLTGGETPSLGWNLGAFCAALVCGGIALQLSAPRFPRMARRVRR